MLLLIESSRLSLSESVLASSAPCVFLSLFFEIAFRPDQPPANGGLVFHRDWAMKPVQDLIDAYSRSKGSVKHENTVGQMFVSSL